MRAETSVTSAPPTDPQTSGGVLNAQWPDGHPLRKQILLVLCLSLLAGVIDNTVLNTALPTLARVLHAGTSSLQWIVDAYTLCFAALLILRHLADQFVQRQVGRKTPDAAPQFPVRVMHGHKDPALQIKVFAGGCRRKLETAA